MKETYNQKILQYMLNSSSTNFNFREPYIKRSLIYVYPLFMLLHAIVCLVGIISNIAMVAVIVRRRLYQDQTFVLFINLAFADFIKCVFVMPMTLANLLIQNWLFGSFLCFFMPMLQYFPVHATMLTFLTIAIDRYRLIVQPFKSRVQASLCIIAIWVGSVCLVLPFAIYIKYIDLKATLGEEFDGVGLCTVRVERRIEEYIRAMFVTLYAMPLATMALLYVRISAEMKSKESAASRPLSVHFSPISTSTEIDLDRSSMLHHHHSHASGGNVSSSGISWSPVHEPPSPPTRHHRQELLLQLNGSGDHHNSSSNSRLYHGNAGGTCSQHQGQNNSSTANFLSAPTTAISSASSSPKSDLCSRGHHQHHNHGGHHNHHYHRGSSSTTCSGGGRHSSIQSASGESGGHGGSLTLGVGGGGDRDSRRKFHSYTTTVTNCSDRSTQDSDDDLNLPRERRTQNYLITMNTLFAVCWCPSHILILVNYFVHETDNNVGHYDVTYMLFTWFGFLSTCTTPVLFMSWVMTDAAKDRLRGYFRFSNRRRTSAGSQRRRYQTRFSSSDQGNNFEERMIVECKGAEHYGCDSV